MAQQGDNGGMQRATADLLGVHRDVLRDTAARSKEVFGELRASRAALPICAALRNALPHLNEEQRDVVLLACSSRPAGLESLRA